MNKKLRNFLYPDWRKLTLFLIVVLFLTFMWVHVLINSLPVMIIGTQEFDKTFCDIKLTATDCNLSPDQAYSKEADLNQTVDNLNIKYSQFSDLNVNFGLVNRIIPGGAFSCLMNEKVAALVNDNSQSQSLNILGMTSSCNSLDVSVLIINLFIIYLLICGFFWVYDKRK